MRSVRSHLAPAIALAAAPILAAPAAPRVPLAPPTPLSGGSGASRGALDFEARALEFLEQMGLEEASAQTLDLDQVLAASFLGASLGLFDAWVPAHAFEERAVCEETVAVARSLVAAQLRWLEWLEPGAQGVGDATRDGEAVLKWVKSWKASDLAALAKKGGANLYVALEASDAVRGAGERFAAYMARGTALGLAREPGVREPLVLLPRRPDFVRFLCFAGWLRPELQHIFWDPSIVDWTNSYLDHYKLLAFEFAAPGHAPDDIESSMSMSLKVETGLQQQIVQLAMNSLIDNAYGGRVSPALANGLSINLVVDLFEEAQTRVDGDLRSRRTEAREVFVPGGASSGGVLAVNSAASRWRQHGHGRQRFVPALSMALSAGAAEVKKAEKLRSFELVSDDESERRVVQAPFLGSAAADAEQLPEEFRGDQLEFLRAYRCAFMWWLREKSESSGKKSAAAFASLLRNLAQTDEGLEAAFAKAFGGVPLSSAALDRSKDLEGRFLYWLSKQ